jgi:hypothetical protein
MRIFFAPHHAGSLPLNSPSIPLLLSARRPSPATSIEKLIRNEFKLTTANTGNLVHSEAPSDILQCSEKDSVRANLGAYMNYCSKEVGMEQGIDALTNNYDAFVISMANDLRPGVTGDYYSFLAKLLRRSPVPIHILGIGLQDGNLKKNHLKPEIIEFLDASNHCATTFGVRCEYTQEWLHKEGYTNAIALGCPSMYRSPLGVLHATQSRLQTVFSTVSAGYLNAKQRHDKLESIMSRLNPFKSAYIFQNDLVEFAKNVSYSGESGVYNYWTSSLDSNLISLTYYEKHGRHSPFSEFKVFTDVRAWIAYSSLFDLFIGDRLHGCIAALTGGTPGVLMYQDARVKGLAEFFAIPSVDITVPQFTDTAAALVSDLQSAQKMSKLLCMYSRRIQAFKEHLDRVNLSFNSRTQSEYDLFMASMATI